MDNSDRKTNLNCSCRIVATHLDANIDIQTDRRTDPKCVSFVFKNLYLHPVIQQK